MLIYQITNEITSDFYIGKTKDLAARKQRHRELTANSSALIHRAMRKYGSDNFSFIILESDIEPSQIDDRERYWIAEKKPRYNLTIGGDGGDTSQSPGYKAGMSQRRSYKGSNNPNFGKSPCKGMVRTDEQKATLSAAVKAAWDRNPSRREKARQRMLENNPNRKTI